MTDREQLLRRLLRPAVAAGSRTILMPVIPLLLVSAVLVVVAAWSMPDGYSWTRLTISESAAQGQEHGWLARLSFLCFGAAVLLLAFGMRMQWPRLTYGCQLAFAASMVGAAAFSHLPWQPGVKGDLVEDALHSFFATGMGFAFCVGLIARLLRRERGEILGRLLDLAALLVATMLPIVLAVSAGNGGLMQRAMFGVAYLWFGREALTGLKRMPARSAFGGGP